MGSLIWELMDYTEGCMMLMCAQIMEQMLYNPIAQSIVNSHHGSDLFPWGEIFPGKLIPWGSGGDISGRAISLGAWGSYFPGGLGEI